MSRELFESVSAYMRSHSDYITSTLSRLVKIPSVRSAPAPGAPYGKKCAEALEETRKIYEENGFATEIHQGSGYLLARSGGRGKQIGIFAHADVVSVYDDWMLAEPFSAAIRDGFMISRGALDDKSGIVCSLLAAMAIRDLGIPFSSGLLMVTENNEESGMGGIKRFVREQPMPSASIIADAGYPVFRGEKSFIRFWAVGRGKFETVTELVGGKDAFNIIAGSAHATFESEIFPHGGAPSDPDLTLSSDHKTLSATGISKHAALPEGSKNAIITLTDALLHCDDLPENDRKLFSDIRAILGSFGEGLGVEGNDPRFGRTTAATGMLKLIDGRPAVSYDMRFGTMFDSADLIAKIKERLDSLGFDMEIVEDDKGFFIGDDNEYLKALLEAYSECTGAVDPRPNVNSGATHARLLKNAFGVAAADWHTRPFTLPAGHGDCHQPDECVWLEGVGRAAAILAYMLVRLDRKISG